MNVYGLLAIVILAVLVGLGISAFMLLRSVRQLQRHLEGIQKSPVFSAAERAPEDLARLNGAAAQLSVQIDALRAAADRLNASVTQLKDLSFDAEVRSISKAYSGLADVLQ